LLRGETVTESSVPPVSVSVVIPCLNEAETIEQCVRTASRVLLESGIDGEVIVVDNGSADGSADLARAAGAIVVEERRRGYGAAYLAGFARASGKYLVMIDADLTYDFAEIPRFVDALDAGAGLVMGNRMSGLNPGAMGLVSRIGNPLLSGFLNLLYRTPVRDAHCGMRAVQANVLSTLGLRSTGMEFASEMVIRAARRGVAITEINRVGIRIYLSVGPGVAPPINTTENVGHSSLCVGKPAVDQFLTAVVGELAHRVEHVPDQPSQPLEKCI